MKDPAPQTVYLKDYKASVFTITRTNLIFELSDNDTLVTAELEICRNPFSTDQSNKLVLNGNSDLSLKDLMMNGETLHSSKFVRDENSLTLFDVPESFKLTTVVVIEPHLNTTMMGLYRSRSMYCTQCEAEGFRGITFYLDRPDMMSEFTTTIVANKEQYPILLSNGNPIEQGILDGGRHFVTWHDPFKKPAYLFALVAGTLSIVEDSFVTQSGRRVKLQIFVEEKDLDKCSHAMTSLKHSMRWDEEAYGREYDLDIFMIVAVDDFNMGAMENKGLNIFNTSAVLVNAKTSTDAAFQRVESIVAHEYFHNWSGNRVTCRDWFQLSLKEGFTVYRDSQFSSEMNSSTVKRIEDVAYLRTSQFAEDNGPMAHSVQPESYMEINNFYTVTIYEKGAEVVGMYHTLLGADTFRKASDLYFDRHDGQAATVEDFVIAMEDSSGRDLQQFRRWYKQAGTPFVSASSLYHPGSRSYALTFKQTCPDTPGQADKDPFVIPIRLGLIDADGKSIALNDLGDEEVILEMVESEQTFVFHNIDDEPVPSILRGLSAPVKLDYQYSRQQLVHLMSNDSDGFNRWDAGQSLSLVTLQDLILKILAGEELCLKSDLIEAFSVLLTDENLDPAMVALMLQLPTEALLYELVKEVHPTAINQARSFVRKALAVSLEKQFLTTYHSHNVTSEYEPTAEQIGHRSLKNAALSYLMLVGEVGIDLAWTQFQQANNMTDKAAALRELVNCPLANERAIEALKCFATEYHDEALVMNLWLQIQATNTQVGGLKRVRALMEHESFTMANPNKVRSVIGGFCGANLVNFHCKDGSGYKFLREQVLLLNQVNPQVAARLVTHLTQWKKLAKPYTKLMYDQLKVIADEPNLVKDIYEIVTKSL
jgi:aminopeptidase N